MSQDAKKWWENRVLRSVDNLKLWNENPRLDPSNKLVTVRDYVEELLSDPIDEQNFINLLKSIATRGFMSFDPIVVWKELDTNQFVVAEGNRRVIALKLLRSPEKAPISVRKTVVNYSRMLNRDDIEKIKVVLAPSYEEARWYILQRHSVASNQIRWQRLQQQRFIISVYDSVGQDIEETIDITGFKRVSIIEALRYVRLRDIAARPEVTVYLSPEEREHVYSHKINMTVLERWFGNSQVREAWHIKFDGDGVTINADLPSFYTAYGKFLKLILDKNNELGFLVNTRTIDSHFKVIFDSLPKVNSIQVEGNQPPAEVKAIPPTNNSPENDGKSKPTPKPTLKGNPSRRQFTDRYHDISSSNYKLKALFRELQKLPVHNYPNVAAASIRIFIELAVDEFIISNDLKSEMSRREKKAYNEITLSQKLSILRGEFIDDREANKVIDQLLHNSNDHSVNTLNEYIHGSKVHKVEPQFLNRFWDMLSPLLGVLISLKEI
jgi:hypothetical protein